MRPSEILKLKRAEILQIAEKYGVKNIRVFGSVARGEDDEKSDVDLLMEFPRPFTLLKYASMKRELESIIGFQVEMVSRSFLKTRVRKMILNEARLL
jgi:predicted nucleotidyltransferase